MKRATTLKVLAGTLVLILVASAFPLAEVALKAAEEKRAAAANAKDPSDGALPGVGDLPFPVGEGSLPPAPSGDGLAGPDGSSSRPGGASAASQYRASASGSVLVSQMLGAAELLGYSNVDVPELPVAKVAAKDPLRAAILGWIAATGSVVPPDELARELARADAMPIETQRDIALLLIAATDATLLQRAALSRLTPEQIDWIYAHPEVGEQLANGVDTRETRYMAYLAGLVDMRQSVAASALLLEAVEATRGSLSKADASKVVGSLAAGDIDPTTASILQLLAGAQSSATDQEKVLLAARLVSLASGTSVPALPATPSFADALAALLAQTGQEPGAAAIDEVTKKADLLPLDLQGALAQIILAEANAVKAANPATMTPTSQPEALASMLVATAHALPILEKYGMYWRNAPDALRVSEWDPSARLGWAAHHAGLFVTASDDITTLASVAPILSGHGMATASVPQRSFTDAFLAFAKEGGFRVNASMLAELRSAEAALDPTVRDAAALLLSGSAESARLQKLAFAGLTPEEERFLRHDVAALDGLYAAEAMSEADLDRLARATHLSALVDAQKLGEAALVAAIATNDATQMLRGMDAFTTQSTATQVATGLRGLFARVFPVKTAQAQNAGCPLPEDPFVFVTVCPSQNDVLLRIKYPVFLTQGRTPAEDNAARMMASQSPGPFPFTCDAVECVIYDRPSFGIPLPTDNPQQQSPSGPMVFFPRGYANQDILVITGTASETYLPARETRFICGATLDQSVGYVPNSNCRFDEVYRYGSANIHIDLGGDDVYQMPVAVVATNATVPIAIHIDVGGTDHYNDPTSIYDRLSPQLSDLGVASGHPTQASTPYGGVAILVDAQGVDSYEALSRSQGYGRLGLALLADLGGGNDNYEAAAWSQGASSETFTLGAAILFDQAGNEEYRALTGQGYGLGAVLLDAGGADSYRNGHQALGVPVVGLDIIPGGDVTSLDERTNNRVWLDGPGSINVGLGIDQEVIVGTGQSDSDGFPDVVEFLVGTDPDDPASTPSQDPLVRASALILDTDADGYPDYIERALSTDPEGPTSYPAGFPSGVAIKLPGEVMTTLKSLNLGLETLVGDDQGNLAPFEDAAGSNFTSSDKIVDLRLPLQDAGTIDYACTGQFYPNATAPAGLTPGDNVFASPFVFPNVGAVSVLPTAFEDIEEDPGNGGPATQDSGDPYQMCVYVDYSTSSPGNGASTVPQTDEGATPTRGDRFSFQVPAGILAIGDVVNTTYADDYFVVIDIGGKDYFNNSAGGALIVRTRPILADGQTLNDPEDPGPTRVTNTFLAPSIVVNIDTRGAHEATDAIVTESARDTYANASRDFAQGSYFGVLVDNVGADVYEARDGSQGALGGVLLDLAGVDTYKARDLSQGASLASASAGSQGDSPRRPVSDLPDGGNVPSDSVGAAPRSDSFDGSFGAQHRAVPGILLDFETPTSQNPTRAGANFFTARSHSQGFARGFAEQAIGAKNAPAAYGILATLGVTNDIITANGRYAQGVAGLGGAGILLNEDGGDVYKAGSLISQGATISQRVYTDEPRMNNQSQPALGLLLDLGGGDSYAWSDAVLRRGGVRTDARSDNLTIERSASWSDTSQSGQLVVYADLGVHLDTVKDPNEALAAIMGAGSYDVVSTSTDEAVGYHVYMPTARLAIGTDKATKYDREFAFVVDLGGKNVYEHNAGGLVRDLLARAPPTGQNGASSLKAIPGATEGAGVYGFDVGLFPVTLVLDAGQSDSTYRSQRSFTQGSGFFGVGVVADLGGNDTMVAEPSMGGSMSSAFLAVPATIDANIGADWDGIAPTNMTMTSMEDERFSPNGWEIRVANDNESIYVAIKGRTSSSTDAMRLADTLNVTLDMGRRQSEWDANAKRTGADQVRFSYKDGKCLAEDWGYDATSANVNLRGYKADDVASLPAGSFACRFTESGDVFYEFKKPLVVQAPADRLDLGYCYDEAVGFGYHLNDALSTCQLPASELGLYVEFGDAGAGYYEQGASANARQPLTSYFSWPPGAADQDGEAGHAKTGSIDDEMRDWMAVGLAQLATKGVAPKNERTASLSQGVGLAGVGIVARVGTHYGGSQMTAGDKSQAFGAFGGLGFVIDTAGSDTYVSGKQTLGAADSTGFGLFMDLDGNDVYRPAGDALGFVGGDGGQAGFFDLSGDDHYAWFPANAQKIDQARGVQQNGQQLSPEGNDIGWTQPGGGVGFDYRLASLVRQTVASTSLRVLAGNTRTALNVTAFDPADPTGGPWKNGCTTKSLYDSATGAFRLKGKVCFVATVDLGNGNAHETTHSRLLPEPVPPVTPANAIDDPTVRDLLKQNTQNMTVGGHLNVSAVDFFIDRARVASTVAKNDTNHTVSRWAAPVDLGNMSDGVARGKALPLFSAELDEGYGAFLFYDSFDDSLTEATNAIRTLLIDNPSRPTVKLNCRPDGSPDRCRPAEFTGAANATFSAYAVGLGQSLYVNYTVDHDVGEDGYVQANGWRPYTPASHFPCRGLPAADAQVPLCDILPFYLDRPGVPLTTEPGTEPAPTPANIVPETEGVLYDTATPPLQRELYILDNESFRLAIPSRTSLDPLQDQKTEVVVKLKDELGRDVKTTVGCTSTPPCFWNLGYVLDTAPQIDTVGTVNDARDGVENQLENTDCIGQSPVPPLCPEVPDTIDSFNASSFFRAMQEAINAQTREVSRALEGIGAPLGFAANEVHTRACNDPAGTPCRVLEGRPLLSGALQFCERTPSGNNAAAYNTAQTIDQNATAQGQHKIICYNYYQNEIVPAAAVGDSFLGAATGIVGTQGQVVVDLVNDQLTELGSENLEPGDERIDGINFNDIRFNVTDPAVLPPTSNMCNTTAPKPEERTCIRKEGGSIVIPKGFRIALEFQIKGASSCVQNVCGIFGNALSTAQEGVLEVVNASSNATCAAECVSLYSPEQLHGDPFFLDSLETTDQFNKTIDENEDGSALRNQLNGKGLPASFFYVKAGKPEEQPRFEIRVPAQPSTDVTVTIDDAATGDALVTLRPSAKLVGDVAGTPTRDGGQLNAAYWAAAHEDQPHVNWTAASGPRWTQNSLVYSSEDLEDGVYNVTVRSKDKSNAVSIKREPVLIDHHAPLTSVSTDPFAGKSTLVGSSIPVRWSAFEQGSGLREIYLFTRNGTGGDISDFGTWDQEIKKFPAGVRSTLKPKNAGVVDYLFVSVGVDRAGNVEGAPSIDPRYADVSTAVKAAFASKVALGQVQRVTVDEGNPRYSSLKIDGGHLVSYQGDDFTFVRAGDKIRFEICALDVESSVQLVNLSLDRYDPTLSTLTNVTFTMKEEASCGTNAKLFVNDTWGDINRDRARFPEGVWTAQYEIFDAANNRIRVAGGNLILDHFSPNVTLQDPVLPTGQSAVKPGDLVKIRIIAKDDFGVDEGGIRVDASKFAKNASALKTKSVRVNGVIYQEAQFTVDLPTLQNGVFPVIVTVPDLAGNVTTKETHLAVNFKPFEFVAGSLRVSNATHNSVTLHWKTNEPTSALAKFGTTSVALTGRTPQDLNATVDHALVVTGLQPSTHYFLRAVAVSAGGFTKESDLIEAQTTTALFLSPISPITGDKVSGLVPIKFKGGLLDSSDFVSYTLEVREGGDPKPWTFLTTATRQGDQHELSWNSTRFLDGTNYQLRISAVAGTGAAADRASVVLTSLTSDNTPPSILILSPLLATNDTTPQLVAEAGDSLSGLAQLPSILLVDGTPVPGSLTQEHIAGQRVKLVYNFTQPLAAGIRTFELRVPDRAGNVAKEIWKVAIDGEAPDVKVEKTRFSPGTAAARNGGTVTLNLTITDLSGVSLAVADASGLNPAANATRLVQLVKTDTFHGTVSVTARDPSASIDVPVRVVDLAGNERSITLSVPLDNVAPQVVSTSIAEIKHRRATIEVPANEPILVNGTATAPASPPVTAATTIAAQKAVLVFDGLLPSRTYQYALTAVDLAGNPVQLPGKFDTLKDTVAPSAVGPLSVLDLLNGTLRLQWAPATDDVLVSHYRVYRSDDGVTFRVVAETPVPSYDDGGLPYEKSYVYKVAAVDHGANEGEASPALRAAATAVPQLTVGAVTPTVGTTSTTFRYAVTYLSPGGVSPAYVRIILDGVPQNMSLESGNAKTGAVYVYETRLAPHKRDAPHTYAFEASDGRYTVAFPEGGEPIRGPLVSVGGLSDEDASGLAGFAQRVPLGGVAGVAMALVVALGIAALVRRKKEGSK